jgi:hypothetical protein
VNLQLSSIIPVNGIAVVRRCCSSPPSCCFVSRARRARNPLWGDLDTTKVFCRPGTNFRYRRESPSNFRVCPLFGTPPTGGHPRFRKTRKEKFLKRKPQVSLLGHFTTSVSGCNGYNGHNSSLDYELTLKCVFRKSSKLSYKNSNRPMRPEHPEPPIFVLNIFSNRNVKKSPLHLFPSTNSEVPSSNKPHRLQTSRKAL